MINIRLVNKFGIILFKNMWLIEMLVVVEYIIIIIEGGIKIFKVFVL